jgi:hypothetical protein
VSAARDVDDGAAAARPHGAAIEAGRDESVAQRGTKRRYCVPAGYETHACASAFPGSDAYPPGATVKEHGRLHWHLARARAGAGGDDHAHRHADLGPSRSCGGPRTAAGQGCEQCCENARGNGGACRAVHGHTVSTAPR